jgi:hypothetical protein
MTLALTLAACAGEPRAKTSTVAEAGTDTVCRKEYPTGSNIPVTRCRTREQIEADRRNAADALGRISPGTARAPAGQ